MDSTAVLLTFRTYGTWLPGDARGSVDRWHNAPGTPYAAPNPLRRDYALSLMKSEPVTLDRQQRGAVEHAIGELCRRRGWVIGAVAAQSNHVHVVVTVDRDPWRVIRAMKSWSTRRLREEFGGRGDSPMWARHGSARVLRSNDDIARAIRYVTEGQWGEAWKLRHGSSPGSAAR